ncbi:hypothetical protein HGRIS_007997 [Hohenbuehelia grisea]|uniref:Uncharacterized protein n=1 Tax=Hohenbuehelia grisea TaxID=104357 RepID=A0ABR3J6L1_9AGAR
MRNISIPSTSFVNGTGTFTLQLALAQNRRFVLGMSDATGLVAGGTSAIMTVWPSISRANCNLTEPGIDFFFSLDSDLEQCKPYPFTRYPNASQPVTILASVPGGQSFVLNPPEGDSYNWTANVDAGTSIIFTMFDSTGRAGGTSDVKVVLRSDDTTCLQRDPPVPAHTPSSQQRKLSSGAIAAIVVGVLVFLASLPVAALLFIRREHRRSLVRSPSNQTLDLTGGQSTPRPSPLSTEMAGTITPYNFPSRRPSNAYLPPPAAPTVSSTAASVPGWYPYKPSARAERPELSVVATESELPSRSNTANTRHSRVYVHSDIDETPSEANDDVVELPPQYSARRQPILTSQLAQAGRPGGSSNFLQIPQEEGAL